jgi:hypothetical protein
MGNANDITGALAINKIIYEGIVFEKGVHGIRHRMLIV